MSGGVARVETLTMVMRSARGAGPRASAKRHLARAADRFLRVISLVATYSTAVREDDAVFRGPPKEKRPEGDA